MFAANPRIQLVSIPDNPPCVVIDNALADPQALVDLAVQHRGSFVEAEDHGFPGLELRMHPDFSARLSDFFLQHVRRHFDARRTLASFSRLSMVCRSPGELRPLQRLCHRDFASLDPNQRMFASVLYLFHDPAMGGTSFFRPRQGEEETRELRSRWWHMSGEQFTRETGLQPAYPTGSNAYFERVATVDAAWNRLIFYSGGTYHSGDIRHPGRMVPDPVQGRLTLNGFFVCRPRAGA